MNTKQKQFVHEYVLDHNATRAAIRAGYSPARGRQTGYRLMQMPDVTAAIQRLDHEFAERVGITREELLEQFLDYHKRGKRGFFHCSGDRSTHISSAVGVPEIGAGWVSESELNALIRDSFPHLRVLRHARPDWLTPQHLDVYLPEYNIGVEYQGKQHDKPVEHFGGEDAFAEQQRRDRKKRRLCRQNGCTLIEVRKGYDPVVLVAQLEVLIRQHGESE